MYLSILSPETASAAGVVPCAGTISGTRGSELCIVPVKDETASPAQYPARGVVSSV